jgi:hypothetical protein
MSLQFYCTDIFSCCYLLVILDFGAASIFSQLCISNAFALEVVLSFGHTKKIHFGTSLGLNWNSSLYFYSWSAQAFHPYHKRSIFLSHFFSCSMIYLFVPCFKNRTVIFSSFSFVLSHRFRILPRVIPLRLRILYYYYVNLWANGHMLSFFTIVNDDYKTYIKPWWIASGLTSHHRF